MFDYMTKMFAGVAHLWWKSKLKMLVFPAEIKVIKHLVCIVNWVWFPFKTTIHVIQY